MGEGGSGINKNQPSSLINSYTAGGERENELKPPQISPVTIKKGEMTKVILESTEGELFILYDQIEVNPCPPAAVLHHMQKWGREGGRLLFD